MAHPVLVSAPGKAIIFGEHAVVYGKTAIAASVGLRTYTLLNPTDKKSVKLVFSDIGFEQSWDLEQLAPIREAFVAEGGSFSHPTPISDTVRSHLSPLLSVDPASSKGRAAVAFLYLFLGICDSLLSIEVTVRSLLPVGAGLGSSASFSACLASGLLVFFNRVPVPNVTSKDASNRWSSSDMELTNQWAFMAEKVIHGNPSGIDNSVCVHGGAILYTRGKPLEQLVGFTSLRFLVTNTLVPKDTLVQVANVAKRRERYPDIFNHIIEAVQGVSRACVDAVEKYESSGKQHSDKAALYDAIEFLIDTNQTLLVSLGVSHSSLENVRSIAARHGLFTKLTGGGGGGCAVTVTAGYESFVTSVGCAGVACHDILQTAELLRGDDKAVSSDRFLRADLITLRNCFQDEIM
ncbi:hypothetical protein HDU93_000284 [Gonapodya sp. JEL0774]|nr:hypothetical protein HDU93_000284 [Gonapodya sp. JEL0774]